MTVKEVIERLKRYPEDAKVEYWDEYDFRSIEDIWFDEVKVYIQ